MPRTLYVDNNIITKDKRFSYLSGDVVAAGTTIRVQSIIGFESLSTSSGQIVCIGEIGNEKTELRRTSNSTGPSSSYQEITLRDTLQFDHPQDTKVYIVDYNRADFQWSSTTAGTKSTLRAYPLDLLPDQPETLYTDSTQTAGFYFVRFNETVGGTNSDFSDPIPFVGYADNTVFMIKQRALEATNEKIDTNLITHDFLNNSLWEGRREYHQMPGKRPFRRIFNFPVGSVATGMYNIAVPTALQRPATAENVYGVRIGFNQNLEYVDKKEWDKYFQGAAHTTLDRDYAVGARDLYVSSARDFATTGVVSIGQTSITYSAKSNAGGTLRISVDGSWGASAGDDVWQNVIYGLPDRFTVFTSPDGTNAIYFNRALDTAYVGLNIYTDYYRTLVPFDSDADVLDEPEFDMFVPWLSFKIKQRKNQGLEPLTDPDYQTWTSRKNNALQNERLETDVRLKPGVDHLPLPLP